MCDLGKRFKTFSIQSFLTNNEASKFLLLRYCPKFLEKVEINSEFLMHGHHAMCIVGKWHIDSIKQEKGGFGFLN